MPGMYGYRISKGELYFRGNHLKVVRSKHMLWKKFEMLNYEVLIPPDEVFETFVNLSCRKMSFLINTCIILISDFMSFK